MKVLFTSSQETCLENINQLRNFQNNNIKKETEGSFLNQNNVFTYCQYEIEDINKLKLDVLHLKFPKSLNKFSNRKPNFLLRKLFLILNKNLIEQLVDNHSVFVFSPGGFIEYEIAYKMKKQGKKTILIEGGLQPFDKSKERILIKTLNNFVSFIISNIFKLKLFKFGPFKIKFQELDYVVTTGNSSSLIWNDSGLSSEKIIEAGVPRFEKYFAVSDIKSDEKIIIYGTGAYNFHSDVYGEKKDKEILKNIYEFMKKDYPGTKFYVSVHPRDNNFEILNKFPRELLIDSTHEIFRNSNYLFLSRRSSMVYEYTLLGRPAYFVQPESSRINFPVEDLILNNMDELKQKISSFLTQDLVVDKSLAYGTITKDTIVSSSLINDLIYNV